MIYNEKSNRLETIHKQAIGDLLRYLQSEFYDAPMLITANNSLTKTGLRVVKAIEKSSGTVLLKQ